MAVVAEKKRIVPNAKLKHRGQLPVKRSINLASLGEKPIKLSLAIPGIVLIILAAFLFSKFLVIDRLAEVNAAQGRVTSLQNRLDAGYRELTDYDDLVEQYAHYTYSGMTQEELERVDRADIINLIQRVILPDVGVASWSVSGNQLTVNMTAKTLEEINRMVQKLDQNELVEFSNILSAVSTEERRVEEKTTNGVLVRTVEQEDYTIVNAKVLIYLKAQTEVDAG